MDVMLPPPPVWRRSPQGRFAEQRAAMGRAVDRVRAEMVAEDEEGGDA